MLLPKTLVCLLPLGKKYIYINIFPHPTRPYMTWLLPTSSTSGPTMFQSCPSYPSHNNFHSMPQRCQTISLFRAFQFAVLLPMIFFSFSSFRSHLFWQAFPDHIGWNNCPYTTSPSSFYHIAIFYFLYSTHHYFKSYSLFICLHNNHWSFFTLH